MKKMLICKISLVDAVPFQLGDVMIETAIGTGFFENLQFFADVINLTDETAYAYGRQADQILGAWQIGTRYTIGVNYKF